MNFAVTLVVPILNEEDSLPALLDAVKSQYLRPKELIFVDAGSTDAGPALIQKWWLENGWDGGSCRVLLLSGGMPGAGRNVGIRAAQHEWIAFLDGGIRPEPSWLARLCCFAEKKNVSAIFGVCHFFAETPFERAVCALSYGHGATHPVIPASMFRRDTFEQVGFFADHLRAAEDLIWVRQYVEKFGERKICYEALVHYQHFPKRWIDAIRKWKITEYHCVVAGVRSGQQLTYVVLLPLLYYLLFSGMGIGVTLFLLYLILRGVVDPIRRSKDRPWWGGLPSAIGYAVGLAAVLDLAKFVGILQGGLFKLGEFFRSFEGPGGR